MVDGRRSPDSSSQAPSRPLLSQSSRRPDNALATIDHRTSQIASLHPVIEATRRSPSSRISLWIETSAGVMVGPRSGRTSRARSASGKRAAAPPPTSSPATRNSQGTATHRQQQPPLHARASKARPRRANPQSLHKDRPSPGAKSLHAAQIRPIRPIRPIPWRPPAQRADGSAGPASEEVLRGVGILRPPASGLRPASRQFVKGGRQRTEAGRRCCPGRFRTGTWTRRCTLRRLLPGPGRFPGRNGPRRRSAI